MEPAAAQRDPKTPGGGKPESASGGVPPGAGLDSWPGEQEEDQRDRDSSSSAQLQGERSPGHWLSLAILPGTGSLHPSPFCPGCGKEGGRKGTSPPCLDLKMGSPIFFTVCLKAPSLCAIPSVTTITPSPLSKYNP